MRVNEDGWLEAAGSGCQVKRYPTVRTTPLSTPRPLGVVWHWTGGRGGPGFGEALARDAQGYRRGVDAPASWHVLVAKDGAVYQSAPFNVGTWHVGRPGALAGKRLANINTASIGVELENAGRLRRLGEGFYCWPYYANPEAPEASRRPSQQCRVADARAVAMNEGLFDAFTATQEDSAEALVRALASRYGLVRADCAYAHSDFDSARREDAGPVWRRTVLPRILGRVFGADAGDAAARPVAPAQGSA